MNMFVAKHSTYKQNLGAIRRWGLIPRLPIEHNYKGGYDALARQPCGVYVLDLDERSWLERDCMDKGKATTVEVIYVGPMMKDSLVEDAWVLLERVPPQWIGRDITD